LIPEEFNLQQQVTPNITFNSSSLSWRDTTSNKKGLHDLTYSEVKSQMQALLKTAETDPAAADSLHELFDFLMGLMNGTSNEGTSDLSLTAFGPFGLLFGSELNSSTNGQLIEFALEQGWDIDLTGAANAISYYKDTDTGRLVAFSDLAPHLADSNIKGVTSELIATMAHSSVLQLGKNAVLPAITLNDRIISDMASNGSFVGADFSNVTWDNVMGSTMTQLVKAPGYSKENAYTFDNATYTAYGSYLLPQEELSGSWAIKIRGSNLTKGKTRPAGLALYGVTEVDGDIATIEQIEWDY